MTSLCLLIAAGGASAKNAAECVIDDMPGVANDAAAWAIWQVCLNEHGKIVDVPQGSGRGMFGYSSGAKCTASEAKDTRSAKGAALIGAACRRLYDAPKPGAFDDLVP